MTVQKDIDKKTLGIEYIDCQNDKGEDSIKKFNYNNVKKDAAPDSLLSVTKAIGYLIPDGLSRALTVEAHDLFEQWRCDLWQLRSI